MNSHLLSGLSSSMVVLYCIFHAHNYVHTAIFCLKPSVCLSAFIVTGETNENHVLFKGNYGAVK